jgi:hypothetical protein
VDFPHYNMAGWQGKTAATNGVFRPNKPENLIVGRGAIFYPFRTLVRPVLRRRLDTFLWRMNLM